MSSNPPLESDAHDGSPASDRLIRAFSPALALELGRLLDEQKKRLLAEANIQLRKALLDKEAEMKGRSEAVVAEARAQTSETVRLEVTRQLESKFEEKLASELAALRDRYDQVNRQAAADWQTEREELGREVERWRALTEFYRRSGAATSQTEILKRFLTAAGHFAGSVALYLNRPDGLARWGTEGDRSAFPELASEGTRDPEWYWAPITVRSRTVVVVGAIEVGHKDALDVLVGALRRAIETLGLRLGSGDRGAEPERSDPRPSTVAPGGDRV